MCWTLKENRYVVYERKIFLVSLNSLALKNYYQKLLQRACKQNVFVQFITDVNVIQEILFIYLTILYLITTV